MPRFFNSERYCACWGVRDFVTTQAWKFSVSSSSRLLIFTLPSAALIEDVHGSEVYSEAHCSR
jgi:hypothetical protein